MIGRSPQISRGFLWEVSRFPMAVAAGHEASQSAPGNFLRVSDYFFFCWSLITPQARSPSAARKLPAGWLASWSAGARSVSPWPGTRLGGDSWTFVHGITSTTRPYLIGAVDGNAKLPAVVELDAAIDVFDAEPAFLEPGFARLVVHARLNLFQPGRCEAYPIVLDFEPNVIRLCVWRAP